MRFRLGFLYASILFAVGCGSSDENPPVTPADTGVADVTVDTGKPETAADTGSSETTPGDTASIGDTAGIKCGEKVCGMGQVCCVSGDPDSGFALTCAATCPDGGASLSCDGPEDCPTGAKTCCAEVNVEGSVPACTFETGTAECRGTCASNVPSSCPSTAIARRCHKHADCTEAEYNKCCEFSSGGTTATFCASETLQFFGDCSKGD